MPISLEMLLRDAKVLDQEVDERTNTRRLITAAWIVDKQVGRRQQEFRQHDFQPAAVQIFSKIPFGADRDTVPIERPAEHDVAIIARQPALYLDRHRLAVARETPDTVSIVVLPVEDRPMPREI